MLTNWRPSHSVRGRIDPRSTHVPSRPRRHRRLCRRPRWPHFRRHTGDCCGDRGEHQSFNPQCWRVSSLYGQVDGGCVPIECDGSKSVSVGQRLQRNHKYSEFGRADERHGRRSEWAVGNYLPIGRIHVASGIDSDRNAGVQICQPTGRQRILHGLLVGCSRRCRQYLVLHRCCRSVCQLRDRDCSWNPEERHLDCWSVFNCEHGNRYCR